MADKANKKATSPNLDWKNDEFVIGALIALYNRQTADEQMYNGTVHNNDIGFNGFDAEPMSNIAKWYLDKEFLTPKQINFARNTLKKYHRQLSNMHIKLLPVSKNGNKKKEQFEEYKKAGIKDGKIWIKFKLKDRRYFMNTVADVKTITGRRWMKDQACWIVPMTIEAAEKLMAWNFELAPTLKEWVNKMLKPIKIDTNIQIPDLQLELYPFQKEAVAFIEARNGNAFVGSEMGLGKTAIALAYLQLHPELRPAVIITPANVKYNWGREAQRFMKSPELYIINGQYNPEDPYYQTHQITQSSTGEGPIIIINYDILRNKTIKVPDPRNPKKMKKEEIRNTGWGDYLASLDLKIIIADEAHKIKNPKSLQSKAVQRISKKAERHIFMSGTPIENRPEEFFTSLNIVAREMFPAVWPYKMRYCKPTRSPWTTSGWEFKGASNIEELHEKLQKVMIRQLKKDVMKDLPDKQRAVVIMDINNRNEYREAANDIVSWIAENCGTEAAIRASRNEILVKFGKLKQLAVKGKLDNCINWIEDYLESKPKLVVFADHRSTVKKLENHFGKRAVTIDGGTPQKSRPIITAAFQEDPSVKLLIGTKSAVEGITLTSASDTCTIELFWEPMKHKQAEDRVHRIGQTADKCIAYYLLAAETIEEDIAALLDKKQKVITAILDGEAVNESDILTELIQEIIK